MRPFSRGFVSLLLAFLSNFGWLLVYFHASTSQRPLFALFMMTDRYTWQGNARERSEMRPLFRTFTLLPVCDRFFQRCGAKEWVTWNLLKCCFQKAFTYTYNSTDLASDYISIWKCVILPTVSILEQKKLQARLFLLVVLLIFQGPACQTYQRCYRIICWQRSTGCTSQSWVINKSLFSRSIPYQTKELRSFSNVLPNINEGFFFSVFPLTFLKCKVFLHLDPAQTLFFVLLHFYFQAIFSSS